MMPSFLYRATHVAVILPAILAAAAGPVQAHELPAPHLIHAYEGWVALAVVVLALAGAGLLIKRALRR
jgi:ABC-type enterobactin transport system permease subunit